MHRHDNDLTRNGELFEFIPDSVMVEDARGKMPDARLEMPDARLEMPDDFFWNLDPL